MVALFPLSRQWLGFGRNFRAPGVLTRYGRTTGHLAEGTPGRAAPERTRRAFAPARPTRPLTGHLPVVGIVGDTLADHGEEVARICRWAAAHPASARRAVEPR
ncbi:hypothetical protein C1I98_07570 [Spongiactinospora gelatinilytica]|uniref:Uncharacterized protein n=1 Tax=Spongiactinospora gelatinilytica TaxID=2666298 RepID=A0A2W2GRC3_9ACTN|nr:hypothetical protein [Spongiactinospora gelatinilytica]PZG52076.1 hypothetical protein C1I98_07570 [Spongiactinospora gelatinilytica]